MLKITNIIIVIIIIIIVDSNKCAVREISGFPNFLIVSVFIKHSYKVS